MNKKEIASIRREDKGHSYQPYYAVGDSNGDGKEDFAVALINKHKRRDRFALAIFNGNSSRPAYFEEGYDLSGGDISFGEIEANEDVRQEMLVVGPFNSDNCVILKPRGKGYVVQACIEE